MSGQDLEEGDDGVFRIARKVAKDRVISTVDPEARHGHKTADQRLRRLQGLMPISALTLECRVARNAALKIGTGQIPC